MSRERLLTDLYQRVVTPLTSFNPEAAHDALFLAMRVLERSDTFLGFVRKEFGLESQKLHVKALGLELPSPFVLAAGLIKYGQGASFIAALGPGGIEAGTFTLQERKGNPRVRMEGQVRVRRIEKFSDGTVINWMGLPNPGIENGLSSLQRTKEKAGVPLGINIAPTPENSLEEQINDLHLMAKFLKNFNPSWITLNVSCPNVNHPEERKAQLKQALALMESFAKTCQALEMKTPLMVKIGPDMEISELWQLINAAQTEGYKGIVTTNTTVDRIGGGREAYAYIKKGGLSGPLLFERSLRTVERAKQIQSQLGGPPLVVVACGGIDSIAKWRQMQDAGADFCQIMTGFIFGGPYFFKEAKRELLDNPHGL